jgi:leucyl/phenylalanyl-tRNA---protein transferase
MGDMLPPLLRPWLPPAMADPDGLVGTGGDLFPATLVQAYMDGVFPWFGPGDPILWWSPDPRGVIDFDHFHVPRRLHRTLRQGRFTFTVDRCFADVMRACGDNRPEGTWVTDLMLAAYTRLHRLRIAHSLEVWQGEDLVGGVYGVALGGLFSAESMFHRVTDASKAGLVALVEYLRGRGYDWIDVQLTNNHTRQFGAMDIPREDYIKRLRRALQRHEVRFA